MNPAKKFEVIAEAKCSISKSCSIGKVSRSGFYKWLTRIELSPWLTEREFMVVLVFEDRKHRVGAKQIKMILKREFDFVIALSSIRLTMKKLHLVCCIRKKKNYSLKNVGEEHLDLPNFLDQNFEVTRPDEVYTTDISFLEYGSGQRAYLSVVKDLFTKEVIQFNVSRRATLDLALDGLEALYDNITSHDRALMMVHSDQGSHYTSRCYRELLDEKGILQSMSRRGNCYDNSPTETLFAILKDEIDWSLCKTYESLCKEVKRAIDYYNNRRPQWGLKGKAPAEMRGLSV